MFNSVNQILFQNNCVQNFFIRQGSYWGCQQWPIEVKWTNPHYFSWENELSSRSNAWKSVGLWFFKVAQKLRTPFLITPVGLGHTLTQQLVRSVLHSISAVLEPVKATDWVFHIGSAMFVATFNLVTQPRTTIFEYSSMNIRPDNVEADAHHLKVILV